MLTVMHLSLSFFRFTFKFGQLKIGIRTKELIYSGMLKLFEATISVAKANTMAGNTSVSLKGKFKLSFPITPSP